MSVLCSLQGHWPSWSDNWPLVTPQPAGAPREPLPPLCIPSGDQGAVNNPVQLVKWPAACWPGTVQAAAGHCSGEGSTSACSVTEPDRASDSKVFSFSSLRRTRQFPHTDLIVHGAPRFMARGINARKINGRRMIFSSTDTWLTGCLRLVRFATLLIAPRKPSKLCTQSSG